MAYSSNGSVAPDVNDPSGLAFAGFEDFLNVDANTFLDDSGPPQPSPAPLYVSAGTSQSGGAVPALDAFHSPMSFVHPHQSAVWLDQTAWLGQDPHMKHAPVNFNHKMYQHPYSGPQIDFSFVAGDNSNHLGVGESENVPLSSPSVSGGSQSCFSDILFSSPSTSSLSNFNGADQSLESTFSHVSRRRTPSSEGRAPAMAVSDTRGASTTVTKAVDETTFKTPILPASAIPHARPHRFSSLRSLRPQSPLEEYLESVPASPSNLSSNQEVHVPHLFKFPSELYLRSSRPYFTPAQSACSLHSPLSPRLSCQQTDQVRTLTRDCHLADPSMIQTHTQAHPPHTTGLTPPYHVGPISGQLSHPVSPATSPNSSHSWNTHPRGAPGESPQYMSTNTWASYPSYTSSRRPSMHSIASNRGFSRGSPQQTGAEGEDDGKERTQCPYPDCGKAFKDLKAHMLTHQNERPEKCPITSCEFHKRGFARKYDRNRHLVTTHYKATIVCGFCPGSGSSAEKTFNRTDVFKRHLVAVHGVELTPSNAKRKTPSVNSRRQSPSLPDDVTGKCSTCGTRFATAQDLFEHFDDCVLKVVTQTDPAEDANEKNLMSVVEDGDVKATLEKHSLSNDLESASDLSQQDEADENSDEAEEVLNTSSRGTKSGARSMAVPKSRTGGDSQRTGTDAHVSKSTKGPNHAGKVGTAGMTYSKGGVPLAVAKGRKKRKQYPQSWGCSADKMRLKKRVLCVFDGQRRLWKDDMMLGDDFEVRMQLPGAEDGSYVTDLDVETLKRAEAFHNTTEEERGPWIPSNYSGDWNLIHQQLAAS